MTWFFSLAKTEPKSIVSQPKKKKPQLDLSDVQKKKALLQRLTNNELSWPTGD
jgi:hypothetical protein